MIHWAYLLASILFEVLGTSFLKLTFQPERTVLGYGALVVGFYVISFTLLGLSMRHLDLSVVYAIWAGLGVSLVAIIGVVFFGDQITILRLVSIGLIVVGIIGLNLSGVAR